MSQQVCLGGNMNSKSTLLPGMVEWTLLQDNPDRISCSFGCGYVFLDVCGFTKLTELVSSQGHYGVEVITNLLNQYFDLLSDKVTEYGGQILKFEGDAVLAAFPLPEAGCLDKLRTCMDEFRKALNELNITLQREYGSSLAYHGAIGYGQSQMIILGCPEIHLDYFVYSPVMPELYQLCEHAGHNETLIVGDQHGSQATDVPLGEACPRIEMPQFAKLEYDLSFFPPEILNRGRSVSFSGELRNSAILFIGVEAGQAIRDGDYTAINAYYCSIQRIITRLEGMVNKIDYTDKGMILLISFGILHTHVDDIERAIIAANQINRIESPLKAKIGLTYSNLYAGVLGAKLRHEYGIIGNGVNVAARLMTSADYGQIVFTGEILGSVESRFEVKFLRKAVVKGIKGELEFYLILRELPEFVNSYVKQYHDKPQVAYLEETAQIMQKLDKKALNQALLCGAHGTGKSFLGWQILKRYYERGSKIAVFVMDEYNRHDSLVLMRKLLGKAMLCDDPLADPEALNGFLQENLDELEIQMLQKALGLREMESGLPDDGNKKLELLVSSLYKSFQKLISGYEAILLDNAQWLDDLSLQVLGRRLKDKSRLSELLILTGDEHFPQQVEVSNKRSYLVLMGDLEKQRANSLIRSRIPNITQQGSTMIRELADGNPRFIVELCAQINKLFPDPDLLITAQNIQEIQNKGLLPYSVENLFMMKYEGLSEAAKEVLKKASIIGKGFTLNEIIETQSHRKNEDISSVISELKEKEIIDITDLAPEVQYLFNNVLMRQAVYSTILRGEKKDLHNRIARFYENKYAQRLEQNSELLAYHYHLGENKEKALCYSRLAAQRNQAVNNHGEAVYFFQIALQNSGNPNEKTELTLSIVDSQFYLGDRDIALATLEKIDLKTITDKLSLSKYHFLKTRAFYLGSQYETLAEYLTKVTDFDGKYGAQTRIYQLDTLQKLFRTDEFQIIYTSEKQHYQKMIAKALNLKNSNTSIDKLLDIYKQLPAEQQTEDKRMSLYLLLKLEAITLNGLINTGKYRQALKSCLFQYELASALKDDLSLRIASGALGIIYTKMGDTEKAYKAYVEAIGIADRISDRFGFAKVLLDLGTLYRRMGDHSKALQNFQRSAKVFEALDNKEYQGIVAHCIGEMYHWEAKYDLAVKHYRKELKLSVQIGDLIGVSYAQDAIGDMFFHSNKLEKAKAIYHKNLIHQQKIGDNEGIAHTYGNLGNVAKEEGNFPLAIEHYQKNIDLTAEAGDTDGNGRGYFNLSILYEKMEDLPKAIENMSIALERFTAAGSTQFIELATKCLSELKQKLAENKQ